MVNKSRTFSLGFCLSDKHQALFAVDTSRAKRQHSDGGSAACSGRHRQPELLVGGGARKALFDRQQAILNKFWVRVRMAGTGAKLECWMLDVDFGSNWILEDAFFPSSSICGSRGICADRGQRSQRSIRSPPNRAGIWRTRCVDGGSRREGRSQWGQQGRVQDLDDAGTDLRNTAP